MLPKISKKGFQRLSQDLEDDNAHFRTENVEVGDYINVFYHDLTGIVTKIKPASIGDPSSKLFTVETEDGLQEFNLADSELIIIDYYDK